MMPDCVDTHAERELVARQRAALITYLLCQGATLSTSDVARVTGLGWRGAYDLMATISGVIPVTCDLAHWYISDRGNGRK